MKLSPEDITEFKKAYRLDMGEDLPDEEAEKLGTELVRLFELIYLPENLDSRAPP
jgi:hypothetical protein